MRVPLLQIAVSQSPVDKLVRCPFEREVFPSLVQGQVAAKDFHVFLLPRKKKRKKYFEAVAIFKQLFIY